MPSTVVAPSGLTEADADSNGSGSRSATAGPPAKSCSRPASRPAISSHCMRTATDVLPW